MIDANGIIRIDTSTTPPKGVEIRDLQVSLGRGTSDLGLLCSDQEWYDTGQTDQQQGFGQHHRKGTYGQQSGCCFHHRSFRPHSFLLRYRIELIEMALIVKYPFGQSATIGGARVLVAAGTPVTGTVPAGAYYMTFGQNAPDGTGVNLFPSAISIGTDIVDVSQYR